MRPNNFIDLSGARFGALVATRSLGYAPGGTRWECQCDCGAVVVAYSQNLRRGRSTSCGCAKSAKIASALTRHGHARRGRVTSEHRIWRAMLDRCSNPNNNSFKYYGGRGITVCDRWTDFENFLADMGNRPSRGHSIDRIDVNGNYEPSNCRWATASEQRRNRRDTR